MDLAATFSDIAQQISANFGGPYHAGIVLGQSAPIMDTGGSIATPGQPTNRNCMVQVDRATEAIRQSEGYADGDVLFLILAATLDGAMDTDARVEVLSGPHVGTWQVAQVQLDSLAIYWQGRGRRA